MKLKYTALGNNSQKLEGVLDADSIEAGRDELHKMGLAIIAINEVSEEEAAHSKNSATEAKKQEGISTFYFLAQDSQRKEVNGTIDSKSANSAFRRLMLEYGFEVLNLYPEGASNPEAASLQPQFSMWKLEMEDEGIDLNKRKISQRKGELEESEKMDVEVINEIDQFIINTKALVDKHSQKYSDAFLREIKKTLGELEKIRASNNLKHITKVCNNLYELISNPDQIELASDNEAESEAAYQEAISRLKSNGFVSNPFQFLESQNLEKRFPVLGKAHELVNRIGEKLGRKKEAQKNAQQRKRNRFLGRILRKLHGKSDDESPRFIVVIKKFFSYLTASSPILRRAKKQEMLKSFKAWKNQRKQVALTKKTDREAKKSDHPIVDQKTQKAGAEVRPKKDYSLFFMELDSFVGWLLFFYLLYFYLSGFAIEKNIGLPQEIVLKSFNSPLIINISILLLMAHLTLNLKIRYFRSNFLGSLFLFFLSIGTYALLMVNF